MYQLNSTWTNTNVQFDSTQLKPTCYKIQLNSIQIHDTFTFSTVNPKGRQTAVQWIPKVDLTNLSPQSTAQLMYESNIYSAAHNWIRFTKRFRDFLVFVHHKYKSCLYSSNTTHVCTSTAQIQVKLKSTRHVESLPDILLLIDQNVNVKWVEVHNANVKWFEVQNANVFCKYKSNTTSLYECHNPNTKSWRCFCILKVLTKPTTAWIVWT